MGKFRKFSEEDAYIDKYCSRCVNWRKNENREVLGCPVWDAHLIYNQDGRSAVGKILNLFIMNFEGENLECEMFLQKEGELPGQGHIDFGTQ